MSCRTNDGVDLGEDGTHSRLNDDVGHGCVDSHSFPIRSCCGGYWRKYRDLFPLLSARGIEAGV